MAARREGPRRRVLPPPAPAGVPIIMMRRGRGRTDLPAFLMLLGASVVVRSASAGATSPSATACGDCLLAGFLLWLLGVMLLSFHRAQTLRRLIVGRLLRRFF